MELETNLVHTGNSRIAKATQKSSVLKQRDIIKNLGYHTHAHKLFVVSLTTSTCQALAKKE